MFALDFLLICKHCHRRDVASLRLFYYGKCCSELVDLVPPKRVTVRSTHCHTVNSPMCRTKFYQSNFFPRTAALWNSLTSECFPPDCNLTAFKGRVNNLLLLKLPATPYIWGFSLVMGDLYKKNPICSLFGVNHIRNLELMIVSRGH